ncbi:MAG: SDR family NAD(P)-dependent oxidoreductase, partial [Hyphomonadaceae bacterium]|nr:SDR family NAD(P)-dependent oxidoreductase [Hyphomonadaceae bacterium]
MNRVQGKVALVTGASLGLGRAAAVMLANEGARVVLTDVKAEEGG